VRETAIRAWCVFFFVCHSYGSYTSIHSVLATISVGSGLDEPEDWPLFFGNPYEAYSLRRFWSKFWHKAVYRSYTSYAGLVSEQVIGLPRASISGRLFVNFFVFLTSGIVHAIVYRQIGYTCGAWEEIGWYCLNFIGLVAEMAVQWGYFKTFGYNSRMVPFYKAMGFLWVFGFLFWSLPKYHFPKMLCIPGPIST
jgi:hypothetical protein